MIHDDPSHDRPARRAGATAALAAGIALATLAAAACNRGASAAKEKGGKADRGVPVVAALARAGDLPVVLSGLGTVTPLSVVTVRSRVDGELVGVAFREGQAVAKGDLLAQVDPRPFEVQLHQAEAQLAKDQAALKNARADLERYRVLIAEDSVPRQQLDTQAATVDQIEATLKSDQAQIESARLNLAYSRITAPIGGTVGLRQVDPGNIVHASDPGGLLVIAQQQPIAVVFTVAADRLPEILGATRSGRRLAVEAWDRDLRKKLATGSLLALDNQIDQTTGTVRIKALFPNDDLGLYPNQFVNARLTVDTLRGAVLVPTAALQRSPQSTYVYVVRPDSTVEMRPVEAQLTEGGETAIRKGVSAGESVVVDGVEKLQPGSKVSVSHAGEGRKKAG